MILSSTLRKLAEKAATIYRVDVPAHSITIGGKTVSFPMHHQYFATRPQADKFAAESVLFAGDSVHATITPETASMDRHYWNT